jgi:hypothetical protein
MVTVAETLKQIIATEPFAQQGINPPPDQWAIPEHPGLI